MPKPAKKLSQTKELSPGKTPLGMSPAALTNRHVEKKSDWCPKAEIEFDENCDPLNPKIITYKDINKALVTIKDRIPKTPLMKSRCCAKFGLELYYKIETLHKTGSFQERGALNALENLTQKQQDAGIITASLGNFGLALAYHSRKMNIRTRIVYPEGIPQYFINKCKEYGARVIVQGENYTEAKHEAFVLAVDLGLIYINEYDHPAVIAGVGTIGPEIMEDLPDAEVVLVPVAGGALIAGVAESCKHINPNIEIYGVEPEKCCCFFKAMENDGIFETEVSSSVGARSLGIPMAGYNSFYTAKSLINKMILVDDDWITRAVAHFAEEEKMVVEGGGATGLAVLLAIPNILPEILKKKVVCIMTDSNIEQNMLMRCIERAKAVEGRIIKLTVQVLADSPQQHLHVLSMVANTGCNVLKCTVDHAWLSENDLENQKLKLVIETKGIEHACQLKRVMNKIFPNKCEFLEEPFSPIPICACFPKKRGYRMEH